jgi:pyridoxal phosphate enzyme (YggS family)
MTEIAERLGEVRTRLADAVARAGRNPDDVRLIAVSKNVDADAIRAAHEAGQTDFGENYVQPALAKMDALGDTPGIRWHMIGQLQSNKAARVARAFDVVHSLASTSAARAMSRALGEQGRSSAVLVQVHLGGGTGRGGVEPEQVPALAREVCGLPGLVLDGVMGVAPRDEEARPAFARLRCLLEQLRGLGLEQAPLRELSAGMSEDYEAAILEGATLVRIGRAIFGG